MMEGCLIEVVTNWNDGDNFSDLFDMHLIDIDDHPDDYDDLRNSYAMLLYSVKTTQ